MEELYTSPHSLFVFQRLNAERELARDLKEADATESQEKKAKLVGV